MDHRGMFLGGGMYTGYGQPSQTNGFNWPRFQQFRGQPPNFGPRGPPQVAQDMFLPRPRLLLVPNTGRVFNNGMQGNFGTDFRRGQKRQRDDRDSPSGKRPRPNSNSVPLLVSPASLPSSSAPTETKYIVPVSHGTEKITQAIWTYFLNNQMTDEDLQRKLRLRKSLHAVMEGAFPNCRLFIVGSSMTGFATRLSDVDMCLMISENEIDQKRDATLILSSIAKALRLCSFVRQTQVIRAKVPILKFCDQISGVECDLNINNTVGVRNTHLLRYYAYMDWRVRPLMLFIKKWARFHDINDASKKTISSYSLTLMLIHYLQVEVSPPVLPCLQNLRPDLFTIRGDVRKLSLNFDQDVQFSSENRATLGELFLGFLNYYANVFDFDNQVISVRLGKAIPNRDMPSQNSLQWKFLNIEEPFERSNTARSVYDMYVFRRIVRVFQVSFQTLQKSRDVNQILSRPF